MKQFTWRLGLVWVVVGLALPVVVAGQEEDAGDEEEAGVLAGHSGHGEVFNEGPRQRAYLMGGTGGVSFAATSSNPQVRKFVEQGVGQLHGFWYFEAERSFRHAASLDPECAIAYWGMSMANVSNATRAKGFIAEAMKRKEKASKREGMYIEAWNAYLSAESRETEKDQNRRRDYVKALEKISLDYPEDLEARAFLGLQIWDNRSRLPIQSNLAVDLIFKEIIAKRPLHPVHHYVIHLWDGTDRSDLALASAARCGQGSPAIAHMWHMPGHTYTKLKRYEDAAWQQEASARVDHAFMIRDRVMPDQIHNFAHNNEWLCRNLMMIGRGHDAVDLAKNMIDLPRHPKFNSWEKRGSAQWGRQRLFEALSRYEMWEQVIELAQTRYLEPTENAEQQVVRLRNLGRAQYHMGNMEALRQALTAVDQRMAQGRIRQLAESARGAVARAATRPTSRPAGRGGARGNATEQAVEELKAYLAAGAGDFKGALEGLRKAGSVDAMIVARMQLQAGMEAEAEKTLRREAESKQKEVLPLAGLVSVLHQAGKKEEAGKAFEQLRAVSGSIDDLEARPFARLRHVARELELPEDWRVARKAVEDVGNRPALDSLGPFRWHPSSAASWALKDAEGVEHSLMELRGRPVVLVFHLGYACTHCAGQVRSLAEKSKAFSAAGLKVVTISTDDAEGIKRSIANAKNGLPFTLLSDASMETFKAYRCFDDFENKPLHGTFLIDGEGLVRWQDISYEPFMGLDFLVAEAGRLLNQGTAGGLAAR